MCETDEFRTKWTLPNSRCYTEDDYTEEKVSNSNSTEECMYFLRCALSLGGEKNCPSEDETFYTEQMPNYCFQPSVQYPLDAIIAPYINLVFNTTKEFFSALPDFIEINGTIKCRGYMINQYMILPYSTTMKIRKIERILCASLSDGSAVINGGYDQFCYNNSQTFNNHSYNFIDVCNHSRECISAYRINDGRIDCADEMDEHAEEPLVNACSNIQRYRFRCSDEEPTCLPIHFLGDYFRDYDNNYDEVWMRTDLLLTMLNCNEKSKQDCQIIRQYVENSWKNAPVDRGISAIQSIKTVPFRRYCNTFWDLGSKLDEDIRTCQPLWVCLAEQWQCRNGQCIDVNWILDGQWDCSDASDEEGIFLTNHSLSLHNIQITNRAVLEERFKMIYSHQSFWNLCNFTVEFPCFPVNYSHTPLNNLREKFCISSQKIGDGHVDCMGGTDERNTLEYCGSRFMLEYDFKCLSSGTCINFPDICSNRCPDLTDDKLFCNGLTDSEDCTDKKDFMCFNGTCMPNAKCNDEYDCLYGEDEYYCSLPDANEDSSTELYRTTKEIIVKNIYQKLNLPSFPFTVTKSTTSRIISSTIQRSSPVNNDSDPVSISIAYVCNRGVGVYIQNGSFVCFCPQQYYGEKCQFHSDRVMIILHLNLSRSNYTESTEPAIGLKMLVLFLFEDQILATNEFHVRPAVEIINLKKEIIRFLYSRSNDSLNHKRKRYFNRSNIIEEHPYSIRIEAYELNFNETPRMIAVWKYPIYFDYLPSFRLAKILHFNKLENITNPCSRNPCIEPYQCHQLLNEPMSYLCLCPDNFNEDNCSILDQNCAAGFCPSDTLCKPNYQGLLTREHP
jgi:hypothetical protein